MFKFTEEQIKRYARHIILPEVGGKGQEKLLNSKVLVIGAGGLGSPAILYLAAAGVGTIGIVDFDVVDFSNLQRQVIHNTERVGTPKVESAKKTVEMLNPDVKVITYNTRISKENIMDIIKDYDVVLDGTDNFPTRFLINDACYFAGKPLVSAAMLRFEGQVSVFDYRNKEQSPCYRCGGSRTSSPRSCALLPGGGNSWKYWGHNGLYSGYRGNKAHIGHRRAIGGQAPYHGCPFYGL
jgi:Dinucleotide-utilizing enzymes involved in molybdopterin and thiamine biosynthesis family 2